LIPCERCYGNREQALDATAQPHTVAECVMSLTIRIAGLERQIADLKIIREEIEKGAR